MQLGPLGGVRKILRAARWAGLEDGRVDDDVVAVELHLVPVHAAWRRVR